jgi:hypothetical protein
MEMYEVELGRAPRDLFDQNDMEEDIVFDCLVQTQRLVANGGEAGGRQGVAARKQRHVMAFADKLFG